MRKLTHLLILVSVAGLLTGCASTQSLNLLGNDFKAFTVVVVPNVAENRLDIITPPQGLDSSGKQNGWVGFERGSYGTILFTLNELPSRPRCHTDPALSAEWVLTLVQLTKTGNPTTQKGSNFGSKQEGWIENAIPQMDPADGIAYEKTKNNGLTSFMLANLNNNSGRKDGYYQIKAKRCTDGFELATDPGWGNGGRR